MSIAKGWGVLTPTLTPDLGAELWHLSAASRKPKIPVNNKGDGGTVVLTLTSTATLDPDPDSVPAVGGIPRD